MNRLSLTAKKVLIVSLPIVLLFSPLFVYGEEEIASESRIQKEVDPPTVDVNKPADKPVIKEQAKDSHQHNKEVVKPHDCGCGYKK